MRYVVGIFTNERAWSALVIRVISERGISELTFPPSASAGYDKQYEDLRAYLERKLGDKIEVVAKKDKKITGNFEVAVLQTGELLHSKKVAGQGRAESKEERRAILRQIEVMLQESQE
jgi:hypothetical protein